MRVLCCRLPKLANGQDVALGVLEPGRFEWPHRGNAMLIGLQIWQIVLFKRYSLFS
jgi:hypothetical protein